MTTSWAHTVRGELPSAVRSNVGGTGLALLALAATPWLLVTAITGKSVRQIREDRLVVTSAGLIVLVTAVDWLVRVTWE